MPWATWSSRSPRPTSRPPSRLARTRFAELRALQHDVGELSEQLAARKTIERAKAVLVKAYGMTEADAFRFLQKKAMDQRVAMAVVAEQVLAHGAQDR